MSMPSLARTIAAAVLSVSALASSGAGAQNFERPVRLIVPFAPGGTSDILARLISPKLSAAIGQSVVVENKPGAAGNLGADAVAKAQPDGHTLLLMDVASLATAPSLFSDLTFDVQKDLAPISMVMFGPYVLAVHESVPAKSTNLSPGHSSSQLTCDVVWKFCGFQWKSTLSAWTRFAASMS